MWVRELRKEDIAAFLCESENSEWKTLQRLYVSQWTQKGRYYSVCMQVRELRKEDITAFVCESENSERKTLHVSARIQAKASVVKVS